MTLVSSSELKYDEDDEVVGISYGWVALRAMERSGQA